MKDYAKIKALASQILECIGDESEGGDGTDVEHSEDERGEPMESEVGDMHKGDHTAVLGQGMDIPDKGDRKKRKDDAIALFASTLASKFKK